MSREAGSVFDAYARDSGGEEQDRSVDRQLATLQEWCAHHNVILRHTYTDRARSGTTVAGREDFQRLITDLRRAPDEERPDGVLFWNLKRFARNLTDFQFYLADLRRRGYEHILFLSSDIPEAGNLTPVLETIFAWHAEQESIDNSAEATAGLHALVQMTDKDGNYLGVAPGRAPTGFRREPVNAGVKRNGQPRIVSRWVPDPDVWPLLIKAGRMRAAGKTFREIHAATHLLGSPGTYSTLFRNRIYIGEFHYGGLVLDNFVPAAWTEEEWEQIQRLRRQHIRHNPGHAKTGAGSGHPRRISSDYLLSNILQCGHCGSDMWGGQRKKGEYTWRYYRCAHAKCVSTQPARPSISTPMSSNAPSSST